MERPAPPQRPHHTAPSWHGAFSVVADPAAPRCRYYQPYRAKIGCEVPETFRQLRNPGRECLLDYERPFPNNVPRSASVLAIRHARSGLAEYFPAPSQPLMLTRPTADL